MSIEFLDYLKRGGDIRIKPSLAVEKQASAVNRRLKNDLFKKSKM